MDRSRERLLAYRGPRGAERGRRGRRRSRLSVLVCVVDLICWTLLLLFLAWPWYHPKGERRSIYPHRELRNATISTSRSLSHSHHQNELQKVSQRLLALCYSDSHSEALSPHRPLEREWSWGPWYCCCRGGLDGQWSVGVKERERGTKPRLMRRRRLLVIGRDQARGGRDTRQQTDARRQTPDLHVAGFGWLAGWPMRIDQIKQTEQRDSLRIHLAERFDAMRRDEIVRCRVPRNATPRHAPSRHRLLTSDRLSHVCHCYV